MYLYTTLSVLSLSLSHRMKIIVWVIKQHDNVSEIFTAFSFLCTYCEKARGYYRCRNHVHVSFGSCIALLHSKKTNLLTRKEQSLFPQHTEVLIKTDYQLHCFNRNTTMLHPFVGGLFIQTIRSISFEIKSFLSLAVYRSMDACTNHSQLGII